MTVNRVIKDTMNILFFRNYIFTLDFVGETAVKRNNSSSLSYKQSFLPFKNGYCICWHQDNDLVLGPRITLMMASFFCLALLYVCDAPNIICVHVIQARSMPPPPPTHTHFFLASDNFLNTLSPHTTLWEHALTGSEFKDINSENEAKEE